MRARQALDRFEERDGGKEIRDLLGALGIAFDVLGDGRILTGAIAGDKFLGEGLDRVAVGVGVGHVHPPVPSSSGMAARTSLRRFSALT